jgi:hypothetical protein
LDDGRYSVTIGSITVNYITCPLIIKRTVLGHPQSSLQSVTNAIFHNNQASSGICYGRKKRDDIAQLHFVNTNGNDLGLSGSTRKH